MEDLKVGDRVKLKGESNSPGMTVIKIFNSNTGQGTERIAHCVWFDSSQKQNNGEYPTDALERINK